MKILARVLMMILVIASSSCGRDAPEAGQAPVSFTVMDDSLAPLKRDFNEAAGNVRLLFISGPTCGICLRGLADMNAALLGGTDDPRLRTFVVSVPTLGATEQDARNSASLIDNPYVRHYWEGSGIVGRLFQERMGMNNYAWDMWFIYGPEARWDERLPPSPDFWMHQLGSLPAAKYLDAKTFAAHARSMLSNLPPAKAKPAVTADKGDGNASFGHVAQPPGVALGQHIEGRGGFRNLEAIDSLRMNGTIAFGGERRPLRVTAHRDGRVQRRIGSGPGASVASRGPDGLTEPETGARRGLPWSLEQQLLQSFEIDGPLVNWKEKGHRLAGAMDMARVGDVMAWTLDLRQHEGQHWHVYIDSHTGMELRRVLLDGDGNEVAEMRFSDYRIAEPDTPYPSRFEPEHGGQRVGFFEQPGIVFPYHVEFLGPDGQTIATETFSDIEVEFAEKG